MVRASRGFVDRVLLPEFTELEGALQVYLHEVTLRVIREEIYEDASDAQEVPDALPSNWSSGELCLRTVALGFPIPRQQRVQLIDLGAS